MLHADDNHKDWYDGLPLIPYLNSLPTMERSGEGPIRVPIVDKYKDMGTLVLGKLESGTLEKGMHVIMQPNKRKVKSESIQNQFSFLPPILAYLIHGIRSSYESDLP